MAQGPRITEQENDLSLCADQVRNLWPIADLKTTYRLLRNPVGLGHAPMQAQMFEPGVREKGLNEAAVVGSGPRKCPSRMRRPGGVRVSFVRARGETRPGS